MTVQISIQRAAELKSKPDEQHLGFGKYFTDHMFIMDYSTEKGWHDARVVPYEPLSLDPAAMVLHYGQAVFEGLKAFRAEDGRILLFRPNSNAQRLNQSCGRLQMPEVDEELFLAAVKAVVSVDQEWIPTRPGTSLYIRPFIVATEAGLGVRASDTYKFMIILTPVGAYYDGGLKPVRIHVEQEYVRAVRGGTGATKAAANYAVGLKAQIEAKRWGADQVLWLDAIERKYIEEVGSMNVFFVINGEVVTPKLNGSFLAGITRDSVLKLLRHWNVPVSERPVTMDELAEAAKNGMLQEAFGTGTAAVISPIGCLSWNNSELEIGGGGIGALSQRLYDTMYGMQTGAVEDPFHWVQQINASEWQ